MVLVQVKRDLRPECAVASGAVLHGNTAIHRPTYVFISDDFPHIFAIGVESVAVVCVRSTYVARGIGSGQRGEACPEAKRQTHDLTCRMSKDCGARSVEEMGLGEVKRKEEERRRKMSELYRIDTHRQARVIFGRGLLPIATERVPCPSGGECLIRTRVVSGEPLLWHTVEQAICFNAYVFGRESLTPFERKQHFGHECLISKHGPLQERMLN